jgi:hypothetical protein
MCELLDTWFDQLELFLFPDECRSLRECVVFGRCRKSALTDDLIFSEGILRSRGISRCSAAPIAKLARLGEPQFSRWRHAEPDTTTRKPELDSWELPFSTGPKRFQKTAHTDEELERELARSPLYDTLRQRTLSPLKRPPLSLNNGHTSLLLMTGMLDGFVPRRRPRSCEGSPARSRSFTSPRATKRQAATSSRSKCSRNRRSRSNGPAGTCVAVSKWLPDRRPPTWVRLDTHTLFTCRQQGFLPNDSDDALWQELKQERFTTPLLRGWLPCVRKELEIKSLLARCYTLDCTCCILNATSADLDAIVEFGLQNDLISIQDEAA